MSRIINLITLSTLAIALVGIQSTQGVTALQVENAHQARSHAASHDALARRKRNQASPKSLKKRCKPRKKVESHSSSSSSTSSSHSSAKSAPTHKSSGGGGSGGSGSSGSSGGPGSGPGVGGSKKGALGWPNGNQFLENWKGVDTLYTWGPACPSNAGSLGIQCCPMLWGWNQVGQFEALVKSHTPSCVMGMNEPEQSGQSNIDAKTGAQMWNQYIRPLKGKATLISPATTSDPAGKVWYTDFFAACGGGNKCDVDILATHWYDVSGDALIAYLEDLHNTFQLPMWLTEFACQNFNGGAQCSKSQVDGFQQQVTSYMEGADFIQKYMPFGAMQDMQGVNNLNQLMDGSGNPNALGKAYLPV